MCKRSFENEIKKMNQNESENNEVPLLYQTKTSYEQNPSKADEYLRQSRPIKTQKKHWF